MTEDDITKKKRTALAASLILLSSAPEDARGQRGTDQSDAMVAAVMHMSTRAGNVERVGIEPKFVNADSRLPPPEAEFPTDIVRRLVATGVNARFVTQASAKQCDSSVRSCRLPVGDIHLSLGKPNFVGDAGSIDVILLNAGTERQPIHAAAIRLILRRTDNTWKVVDSVGLWAS